MDVPAPLIAALLTGFLGSAHCLGMCAGISGMIAVNAGRVALATQLPMAIAYNLGRVVSYAALGSAVALLGGSLVSAVPRLAGPVRLASGVIILLIGLQVAFNWRLLTPLETAGARIWTRVAPLAGRLLPVTSVPRALGLGLLWGLLPCGLVYSVLLVAAASTDPVQGGGIMLAFGAGTMPAMVMTGLGALTLSRWAGRTRLAAGLLIVVLGVLTLVSPVETLLFPDSGGHSRHH